MPQPPGFSEPLTPVPRWSSLLLRAALFAALWWVLVEGSLRGWPLTLLTLGAAVWTSTALLPPGRWRIRPAGLLRFLPFFLWESVRGGIDVAGRALHPRLPVRPREVVYPLRLPPGPARVFFAGAVGLFPGTLSTELQPDHVRVHTLDERLPVADTLRQLEERVADLFGEALPQ
jgi:multicomponent Na+:H+ antiporter subunit E